MIVAKEVSQCIPLAGRTCCAQSQTQLRRSIESVHRRRHRERGISQRASHRTREHGGATQRSGNRPVDHDPWSIHIYGYRWHDPLTGRWPSRDPIEENGGLNLYEFVANDGVNLADYLGEEVVFTYDNDVKASDIANAMRSANSCKEKFLKHVKDTVGEKLYSEINERKDYVVTVRISNGTGKTAFDPNVKHDNAVIHADVFWDCCMGILSPEGAISPATALAHELAHALAFLKDPKGVKDRRAVPDKDYDDAEEKRVIEGPEHDIAKKHEEGLRKSHHNGVRIATTSPEKIEVDPNKPPYKRAGGFVLP